MAVVPTGQIFNWLTFGGVSSADYGIYITGEGVYNAPERAVELTQIPGRNGAIPIDLGRWENIEVVYPASTGTMSQADFRTALSDFRNAIASQRGYQRLEDTYHPDEYRMGLFVNGLEVEPTAQGRAGEFDLVFNCKPQRFLTSGETAVAVANGGSIDNPTELPASPMLEITGYGDIAIGTYEITVNNVLMGTIQLCAESETSSDNTALFFNPGLVAPGDTITLQGITVTVKFSPTKTIRPNSTTTSTSGITPERYLLSYVVDGKNSPIFDIKLPAMTFTAGTMSTQTSTCNATFTATDNSTQAVSVEIEAMNFSDYVSVGIDFTAYGSFMPLPNPANCNIKTGVLMADSTVSALGNPTYYDTEIGEAYKISGGEVVPLNSMVILGGADLPVLAPGTNAVTYDNTVTQFKIVPRWWKL